MKSNREHRVPLSDQALAVLQQLKAGSLDGYVFAGRTGAQLSNMSMLMLLRRMGHPTLTSHGFRSSFRDWAAELTNTQAEVAEAALGHVVGDKVELAYRRGDFFEKRRRLIDSWGAFTSSANENDVVVKLRST